MVSKKEEQRVVSNRKLMDAALYEFANHGYRAARLEDIANRAGYTKGLITMRFATKEGLFIKVFNEEVVKYEKLIQPYESLDDLLETTIEACYRFSAEQELSFRLIYMLHNTSQDTPEYYYERLRNSFVGTSIQDTIYKAMEDGKIIEEDPFEVYYWFISFVVRIIMTFKEAGLEGLTASHYMKAFYNKYGRK